MKRSIRIMMLCLACTLVLISSASAANLGGGKVTATSLNFRTEASTDATILACAGYGSPVVVVEQINEEWWSVYYQGTKGYMNSAYLEPVAALDFTVGSGKVTGNGVRLRQGPSLETETITYLYTGAGVDVIGVDGEWYKVTFHAQTGYIHSDFIEILSSADVTRTAGSSEGQEIVDWAMEFLGTPYVYGGSRPGGFDCSGFTYYLYNNSGYPISRRASTQWNDGVQITKDALQVGDLVFFSSNSSSSIEHVGIYIGSNQFIHSSSGGCCVKINNLTDQYYLNNYYGAVRVIAS